MLSSGERDTIQLIDEGWATREVSRVPVISPRTIAQHKVGVVKRWWLVGAPNL